MDDKELDNLVGHIFRDVDDIKICLKRLQETMNVDDTLYYHIKDFLDELDRIDRLVLNYSLSKFSSN